MTAGCGQRAHHGQTEAGHGSVHQGPAVLVKVLMLLRLLIVVNVSLEGKSGSEDMGFTPCMKEFHKIIIT